MDKIQTITSPANELALFDEEAALYFVQGGQFLFRWRENGSGFRSKFVSPTDVKAALAKIETDSGWIPDGIQRVGESAKGPWFVLSIPAQKYSLNIVWSQAKIETIFIPLPHFIYVGIGNDYHIWAIKEKAFSPQAQLFHAPLPNVGSGGAICWGGNNPGPAEAHIARRSFDRFIFSPFNNHSVSGKSKKEPDDIRKYLQGLTISKRKYPAGDLIPLSGSHLTVEERMRQLIAR